MNTRMPIFILSAELANKSPIENELATIALSNELELADVVYAKAQGYYKGTREVSFVIAGLVRGAGLASQEELVQKLAASFQQEAYMYVDANGMASLHRPNGEHMAELGRFEALANGEVPDADEPYTVLADVVYVTRK